MSRCAALRELGAGRFSAARAIGCISFVGLLVYEVDLPRAAVRIGRPNFGLPRVAACLVPLDTGRETGGLEALNGILYRFFARHRNAEVRVVHRDTSLGT